MCKPCSSRIAFSIFATSSSTCASIDHFPSPTYRVHLRVNRSTRRDQRNSPCPPTPAAAPASPPTPCPTRRSRIPRETCNADRQIPWALFVTPRRDNGCCSRDVTRASLGTRGRSIRRSVYLRVKSRLAISLGHCLDDQGSLFPKPAAARTRVSATMLARKGAKLCSNPPPSRSPRLKGRAE